MVGSSAVFGCVLALVMPAGIDAKIPGETHCYGAVCHRVHTLAETAALVGRTIDVTSSYYDDPARDRHTPNTITSSGEAFDATSPFSAASAHFPDGTELLVLNPRNGHASHIRVNDFGPFAGERTLDVTRRVAEDLGFFKSGTAPLRVTVIAAPSAEETRYKAYRRYQPVRGFLGALSGAEFEGLGRQLIAASSVRERGTVRFAEAGPVQPAPVPVPPATPPVVASPTAPPTALPTEAVAMAPPVEIAPRPPVEMPSTPGVAAAAGDPADPRPAHEAVAAGTDPTPTSTGTSVAVAETSPEPAETAPPRAAVGAAFATAAAGQNVAPASGSASITPVVLPPAGANTDRTQLPAETTAGALTRAFASPSPEMVMAMLAIALTTSLLVRRARVPARTLARRADPVRPVVQQPVLLLEADAGGTSRTIADAVALDAPTAAPSIEPAPPAPQGSIISAEFEIYGNVTTPLDLKLFGRVTGDVVCRDAVIASSGVVAGRLIARQASIDGTVTGGIEAEHVHLRPGCRIDGDIVADVLQVDEGAHFEGRVLRRAPKGASRAA